MSTCRCDDFQLAISGTSEYGSTILMPQLILAICIALTSQLEVRVECDQPSIKAGDILFVKTSYRNESKDELIVERPSRMISYVLCVSHDSMESNPLFLGEAGTQEWRLAKGEGIHDTALLVPWAELADPAFDKAAEVRENAYWASGDRSIGIFAVTSSTLFRVSADSKLIPFNRTEWSPRSDILNLSVKGSVLEDGKIRLKLYRNPSAQLSEFNLKVIANYNRRNDRVERNCPVGAIDFDLPLDMQFYDSAALAELITKVDPNSKLHRMLMLIQHFNLWVRTPNGAERDRKEQEILDIASTGGKIESEYLVAKTKKLLGSRKREFGVFKPK